MRVEHGGINKRDTATLEVMRGRMTSEIPTQANCGGYHLAQVYLSPVFTCSPFPKSINIILIYFLLFSPYHSSSKGAANLRKIEKGEDPKRPLPSRIIYILFFYSVRCVLIQKTACV
jgi:hypothetical protein